MTGKRSESLPPKKPRIARKTKRTRRRSRDRGRRETRHPPPPLSLPQVRVPWFPGFRKRTLSVVESPGKHDDTAGQVLLLPPLNSAPRVVSRSRETTRFRRHNS